MGCERLRNVVKTIRYPSELSLISLFNDEVQIKGL